MTLSEIIQVTDNDIGDSQPSLYDGAIAWEAEVIGGKYEIFYWDGIDITQVTDNAIVDQYPSLYGNMIAWQGNDVQAHANEVYYAIKDPTPEPAPVPEPSTILLLCFGFIGFLGFKKKLHK